MSGKAETGEVTGCTISFLHNANAGAPVYAANEKRIYLRLPHHLYSEYLHVLQSGKVLKMVYEEVDGEPNARLYASF